MYVNECGSTVLVKLCIRELDIKGAKLSNRMTNVACFPERRKHTHTHTLSEFKRATSSPLATQERK